VKGIQCFSGERNSAPVGGFQLALNFLSGLPIPGCDIFVVVQSKEISASLDNKFRFPGWISVVLLQ
jgi:hypothetical protein